MITRAEKKALLHFSGRVWRHVLVPSYRWKRDRDFRLWWRAVDLIPDARDMPRGLMGWAVVAESLAYDGARGGK